MKKKLYPMPKTRKDFEFAIAHAFAYALTVSEG